MCRLYGNNGPFYVRNLNIYGGGPRTKSPTDTEGITVFSL